MFPRSPTVQWRQVPLRQHQHVSNVFSCFQTGLVVRGTSCHWHQSRVSFASMSDWLSYRKGFRLKQWKHVFLLILFLFFRKKVLIEIHTYSHCNWWNDTLRINSKYREECHLFWFSVVTWGYNLKSPWGSSSATLLIPICASKHKALGQELLLGTSISLYKTTA